MAARKRVAKDGTQRGLSKGSAEARKLGRVKPGERRANKNKGQGDGRKSPYYESIYQQLTTTVQEHAPWALESDTYQVGIAAAKLARLRG